ncbi:MAG TPA: RecX family transcriptional regulator [Anaerolineaceae bacterium]|nr:RecX family transcriptional regulator [Anaerolineaceae bacterium]
MDRTITGLKAQKRNPNRINVYLDGEYAFAVARIVGAWLYDGLVLSEERIHDLQQQDTREVAFQRAYRFLSYRPRSENEVQRKLVELGFDQPVIAETLDRLRTSGLLGDTQFARTWVENRSTFRPRSHRFLKMELRQKGVEDEVIQQALDETVDEDELAYQAALRRAPRWAKLDRAEFRERLTAYLARLGFSYGTISDLIPRVWSDLQAAGADDTTVVNTETDEESNE